MVQCQKRAGGRALPLRCHEFVKMKGLPPTDACHFHHVQKSQRLASQPVSLVDFSSGSLTLMKEQVLPLEAPGRKRQ